MSTHSNIVATMDHCCREWRQLIDLLAKQHHLSFSEWRIVVHVAEAKKIEQQLLSQPLRIASNNVVNIISSLEKKGFIKKTIKASDKKIRLLQIASKKEKVVKLNHQINQSWFSVIGEGKLKQFESTLQNALDSIQGIHDKFL